ncbi:glycosyltransferase family 4 protein [Bacillus infantis]|uniref:glycosyltransferase family 4 protein n=1 Tax=Bacillus infantis TaxID=324767 RepID=UPI001CD4B22E|nr:glycosyltransferase family 4 protein [Bacillus infantis]MCA1033587.1 glycosyltransferase family 4 protein [Bacillus infantis]
MTTRVCMYVWNHFTNDARVLRECTALADNGYHVDLICIHDPNHVGLPLFEKKNDFFQIFRVRRYPLLLEMLQNLYAYCRKNKAAGALLAISWLVLLIMFPLPAAIISFLFFFLLKTKLKTVWVRAAILARMIMKGFNGRYDIYHANDLNTLPQGWICSKLRISKKKLIYDSHEVQTSRTGYDNPFYKHLEAFLIHKADEVIVENHTRARYCQKVYGFYPYVVHNYPFSIKQNLPVPFPLHQMLGLAKEEKILLYQGGIQTGRGLDKLIEAVPLFKEGILVLIGDGKIKKRLQEKVIQQNLDEKVRFIDKVPLAELPLYTRQAYLGFQVLNNVCFNHYSASSNKLFEYMMSGVPVVACRFPEIRRVVETERTGICIDSHSPREIAGAVNLLLEDRELRDEYSKNAFRARIKYNWDSEKLHFLDLYKKTCHSEEGLRWRKISIK